MIRARFAYYETVGLEPFPSYLVLESDVPEVPVHSNVGQETLMENGGGIPLTPTFGTWKKMGSPIYRGEDENKNSTMGVTMKNLITVFVLLTFSSAARAWDFPRNPDRFPSIGFNVTNSNLSGTRDNISQPSPILTLDQNGTQKVTTNAIGGDIRLPVSDQVTLTVFGNSLATESTFLRQGTYKDAAKLDGYSYGFNIRLYLNK